LTQPHSELSEGELLEQLLAMLPPEGALMLGEVLGILRKGEAGRTAKVQQKLDIAKAFIEILEQRLEIYEQDGIS
jgi:hypothetical protein